MHLLCEGLRGVFKEYCGANRSMMTKQHTSHIQNKGVQKFQAAKMPIITPVKLRWGNLSTGQMLVAHCTNLAFI